MAERARGLARLLVVLYAIFAIAATSRSLLQLATRFDEAPVAYLLSAVAALFPRATVWSYYGAGYLLIPLVLPIVGLWWLRRSRPMT